MTGIARLTGTVKNYDWGGSSFLPGLLHIPNLEKKAFAEYWLGAHPLSVSQLHSENGKNIPLDQHIKADPEKILGRSINKKFGRLPYLLKILDVKDMLSIQVHPAKHEAELEFARENKEKIPLDAPHRNYKDDNHKPELMIALGDFYALHGFKPVEQLRDTLIHTAELTPLLEIFDGTGYDQLYKTAMEIPQDSVNQLMRPLLDRIVPLYHENKLRKDQEDFWAARAALTFNDRDRIDRGIFSIYFFNLLHLSKGEGIFQDAGVPHAYLEGQNVEIMANSDNVLRGGLTNKHVDVKELMKHVRFEETVPRILKGENVQDHEYVYRAAAPDFKLSRFMLAKSDSASFESVTGEIILVLEGSVSLQNENVAIDLEAGQSAFVSSHQKILLKAKLISEVFRASAPTGNSQGVI